MTGTGPPGQVLPLLRLRWSMVRSPGKKALLVVAAAAAAGLVGALLYGLGTAAATVGDGWLRTQALVAYPAALLLFLVVATLAPFLAGGAIELFPPSHLVAFPVTARTRFALSLLLMPFNVTWLLQVLLLAVLVVVGVGGTSLFGSLAGVTLAFVLAGTVVGQAAAWWGTAVRQTRTGRLVTNIAAAALVLLVLTRANQETLFSLGDITVLLPLLDVGLSPLGARWWLAVVGLALAGVFFGALGVRAVRWNQRLANESQGLREGARYRRRAQPSSQVRGLLLTLGRSVSRSKPLRRGLGMLVLLPVLVAAVTELQWTQIVVLPALVAAGAALLFGVNAFALLGGGAAWVSSLPYQPSRLLLAVTGVVAAVIGGATLATTAGVALFAPAAPTTAEVVALLATAVASATWMTATCTRLSVRRPFQADLRGNRDTPAPPGVMAGYSLRLAGTAGLLGLAMAASAQLQVAGPAVLIAAVVLAGAVVRLALTLRRWRQDEVRSRTLLTVAFG